MANEGYTLEQIDKRRRYIENQITQLCLKGTGLVPTNEGKVQIQMLGEELFRMSEGRNQVIFDKAGRVHIMVNFYCNEEARLDYLSANKTLFDHTDTSLKSNLHPAFVINNAPIRGFRLAKYLMPRVNGVNYVASLYNLSPAHSSGGFTVSTDGSVSAVNTTNNATANPDGEEIHVETFTENSFLYLLGARRAFETHGNSSGGKYDADTTEVADPAEYLYQGNVKQTRTGTGPLTWYHDGTPWGVADLVGNVCDICTGFRLKSGELQFIPNNDAGARGLTPSDLSANSEKWKALLEDGSFVNVNENANSYKYDYLADISTGYASFCLAKTLQHQQPNDAPYGSVALKNMTAREGTTANTLLRIMGLFPLLASTPRGTVYMRNTADILKTVYRGGHWVGGSYSGLGWADCCYGFGYASSKIGVRSASKME